MNVVIEKSAANQTTKTIRPLSLNNFSGFCADDPGSIERARYFANSAMTIGTVSTYSIRYLIRKTARKKTEQSA